MSLGSYFNIPDTYTTRHLAHSYWIYVDCAYQPTDESWCEYDLRIKNKCKSVRRQALMNSDTEKIPTDYIFTESTDGVVIFF